MSKTALAKSLGLSRQALYYRPRSPYRDELVRDQILRALHDHPAYGSRALALHLKMNRKRIQRIMRWYAIRPKIMAKTAIAARNQRRLPAKCPIV